MKKFLACGIAVVGGMAVVRFWPEIMPGSRADIPTPQVASRAEAAGDRETTLPADAADGEGEVDGDSLEILARRCEPFRWSLEIENAVPPGQTWELDVTRDFRGRYAADIANREVQTWENYSYWVEIFYQGNLLARGWNATARQVLDRDESPETARYLGVLGRVIAAEWSKDNATRKINNGDIMRWGAELKSGSTTLENLARIIGDRLGQ